MVCLKCSANIKLKTYNNNPMEKAIKITNEKFKINYDGIEVNVKYNLSEILNKLKEGLNNDR